jgi:hypothetical protein
MQESCNVIPKAPTTAKGKEAPLFGAFYLWQCAPSHETKGHAPHFTNGGCYHWQVRSSSIRLVGNKKMQGKCRNCGRRPKLTRHIVEFYFEEEEAKQEANTRNIERYSYPQPMLPNTTEVIE